MTRIIITAAALMLSTSAFAQTAENTTSYGATSKIISLGGHYTVHQVSADGTVVVKTLTGEEAKLAMSSQSELALLSK